MSVLVYVLVYVCFDTADAAPPPTYMRKTMSHMSSFLTHSTTSQLKSDHHQCSKVTSTPQPFCNTPKRCVVLPDRRPQIAIPANHLFQGVNPPQTLHHAACITSSMACADGVHGCCNSRACHALQNCKSRSRVQLQVASGLGTQH